MSHGLLVGLWRCALVAMCALVVAGCTEETRRVMESDAAINAPTIPELQSIAASPIDTVSRNAPRTALVIGNSAYSTLPSLANPANDARLIATRLQQLGFSLEGGGPLVDLSAAQSANALRSYRRKLQRKGGIGVFYFAGHGVQIGGRNFLAPIDAAPETLSEVAREMIALEQVLGTSQSADMNLVILDACRDNPFSGRGGRSAGLSKAEARQVSAGLSEMVAPPGTLVAFATAPGDVALDGSGRNSPYAQALAVALTTPGIRAEDLFIRVRNIVSNTTGGRQVPWETSALQKIAILNEPDRATATVTTSQWDGQWVGTQICTNYEGPGGSKKIEEQGTRLFSVRGGKAVWKQGGTSKEAAWAARNSYREVGISVLQGGAVRARGVHNCCWTDGVQWKDEIEAIVLNGKIDETGEMVLSGNRGPHQCEWRLRRN